MAVAAQSDTAEQKITTFLWSAARSPEEKTELTYHDVQDNYKTQITFTRDKEFRRSDGTHGTWHFEEGKLVLTGADTKDGFTVIFDSSNLSERQLSGRIPGGKWKGHEVLLRAPSDAAREFDQLTLDRDKALATTAEPINRLYQTALEPLQRRATQANDLDAAVRIQQALDKLSARAEIVGTWDFVNHADGVKYVAGFKASHTFFWNGKQVGMWDTDGKKIIVTHYNRGGHSDYYNLPVRDGKLHGTNTHGDKVTITRKTE